MIQALGARALRDACRQVMRWHGEGMVMRLSVNLSVQQLQHDRWLTVVEDALRAVLAPAKINLASFGNMTPHLHWHVIPRFADDAHFPQPVWGTRQRESDAAALAQRRARLPELMREIAQRLPQAAD